MGLKKKTVFCAASAVIVTAYALALPTASGRAVAAPARQTAAFEQVWRADFDGAAGSSPSADDWIVDTGTGYPGGPPNWGTGERQTYTDGGLRKLPGGGHIRRNLWPRVSPSTARFLPARPE
ncbi:membrane protein [Streptomyces noursei ATCC 11455]|nr:membrane protein [Streptomyces noursei ATCC 11455]